MNEIVRKAPRPGVELHVVWMPMVPTDSEEAAHASARMFAGAKVHQYYDPAGALGRAAMRDAFAGCLREGIEGMPADHPFRETLVDWANLPPDEQVLWDAVLFYPKGGEWGGRVPPPSRWAKQVGFWAGDGPSTGMFLKNDCARPPIESDWGVEVREGVEGLGATSNR